MNFNPAAIAAHTARFVGFSNYSSSSSTNNNNNNSNNSNSSNGNKIMEWTNDDALELIEQYRCHTELWNRADPKYKDKLCRFRAWSEIAERFGCSKAEVERKMNVLLTQYRREKHKMFVKIYQGIQPNPSKWYAFKRFDFMEAGGGSHSSHLSLSGGAGTAATAATAGNISAGSAGSGSSGGSNGLNGSSNYEPAAVAAAVAAAAAAAASPSGSGSTSAHHHSRRLKTKELKYFGAMGLNIPMLIASSHQTLDPWNTVGQYSPPISDRSQLRVPLPMPFASTPTSELNIAATRSLFTGSSSAGVGNSGGSGGSGRVMAAASVGGGGGGGGSGAGSSSSDFNASPQKAMDTSDIEDNKDEGTKLERRTSLTGSSSTHDATESSGLLTSETTMAVSGSVEPCDAGSSPIPNTNTHEAHKNQLHSHHSHHHHHHHQQQQQQQTQQHHLTSVPQAVTPTSLPRLAHQHHHQHQHQQHQDELDIKQEFVDYFHAPPPPVLPDPHRSYSSNEENRLQDIDYAQDLRVAAAVKSGINFSQFVLPARDSQRHSTSCDSMEEKYTPPAMPLNMRKLSAVAAQAANAGQMLMNSLLSNESMSDPDGDADADATRSATSPAQLKSSASTTHDASSATAAAAALYAESLNRDDCDFIGSNVSLKLRAMDRTQRIIAEKLISEVLYYGQFNELERTARIQPK